MHTKSEQITESHSHGRQFMAATALILVALTYAAAVWVLTVHRLPEQPLVPTSSFQNQRP